ncbi:hypothetical protein PR048_013932 [Dryococelus australis]|uniref:PiggyBac transposable element-derived protein domain-containing protein n=1 Tax=Dryococelus australis TaxID=614101 RepID=A0ABQ9HTL1_9NEOP|nr:hypothetical protein PR048_013932 [Dryococelus australis]
MAESRCFILIRALLFDDSTTRKVMEETDAAAAVSHIFNMFIENCHKNYAMGAHGCVDVTLVPFRGCVRFLVYIPKKLARYGIKLLCLTDAHKSYLYNSYIYTGKGSYGCHPYPSRAKTPNPISSSGSSYKVPLQDKPKHNL